MNERKKFIPPSVKENTLRKNLDARDNNKTDNKIYTEELLKDNKDFIAQLNHMLKGGIETIGSVFQAVEDTAKELGISKIEILKILDIPKIEDIVTHFHPDNIYTLPPPKGWNYAMEYRRKGEEINAEKYPKKTIKIHPSLSKRKSGWPDDQMLYLKDEEMLFNLYKAYYTEETVYYMGEKPEEKWSFNL